jgi:uncharacterized membrane protein YraQ (UPF0718 family)
MDAMVRALSMAFAMGWEILWPLILGFTLSGIVQAVVSHSEMGRLLPDDRPRSIAIALGLGAASSSCSYAAVALARSIFRKGANFTAISHYFIMDWASVWMDIVGGLLIAGALAAWVPHEFWQGFFLTDHPLLAKVWGPFIGPLVAVVSFVCSVGNIPLAAVLWNNGISFGGVIAFIFADLIVLPILDIYRKYYGLRMVGFLLATFYAAMAVAALIVEVVFGELGLVPTERQAQVVEASIGWNYTTWLNIVFLTVAALLVWRFLKTGGPEMLRMMNAPAQRGMNS